MKPALFRRNREALESQRDEIQSLFDSLFRAPSPQLVLEHLPEAFRSGAIPRMNVSDGEKELLLSFELPGLELKDIDVKLMGKQLVVSGERKWSSERNGQEWQRVESEFGSFSRSVELPDGLNLSPEAFRASYDKGMLEIRIPKTEPTPVSKIQVKQGA